MTNANSFGLAAIGQIAINAHDLDYPMQPYLETSRLHLRPFVENDLTNLHRFWTNSDVRRYLWDDLEITLEQANAEITKSTDSFAARGFGFWATFPKESETLIGFCGLRVFGNSDDVEILYAIEPAYWQKGLATEAAKAILRFGFEECHLKKIYAGADPPNKASIRVMERLGMTYDSHRIVNGLEAIYYSVSSKDFC